MFKLIRLTSNTKQPFDEIASEDVCVCVCACVSVFLSIKKKPTSKQPTGAGSGFQTVTSSCFGEKCFTLFLPCTYLKRLISINNISSSPLFFGVEKDRHPHNFYISGDVQFINSVSACSQYLFMVWIFNTHGSQEE